MDQTHAGKENIFINLVNNHNMTKYRNVLEIKKEEQKQSFQKTQGAK